jgi:hypothetical protein
MNDWEKSSLDFDRNVNWDHITQDPENKEKYAFISINNERGNIQRRLARGWAIWDKETSGYQDVYDLDNKSAAKRSKDGGMVARVPVGMGANGPTEQILMYKPIEQYRAQELATHKRNADAQIGSVTAAAEAKGAAGLTGVDGVKGTGMTQEESGFAPEPGSDVQQGNS